MSEEKYESYEIPGVGEIRARPGTSTSELAGAVKYWHEKYETLSVADQSARVGGFIAGAAVTAVFTLICYAVYYLLN